MTTENNFHGSCFVFFIIDSEQILGHMVTSIS